MTVSAERNDYKSWDAALSAYLSWALGALTPQQMKAAAAQHQASYLQACADLQTAMAADTTQSKQGSRDFFAPVLTAERALSWALGHAAEVAPEHPRTG